ncbi:LysM peptidoglycan-binding domain-containing protein [Rhodalgimonas zhirmunskyi]|uniref:LysM peptidoglycan-binding domain-containing protein n=1 Tax=Rhodalgimonas zhirmunskyi TaxID=2964767 RepID=A0AAJ1U6J1_9RHOB|nr:LysM peptidoglycan-binding domain-containing protein [Rhodoalgimonas zhirmunskyi]MDQ2093944.1 LysM peptidoglycan-binding domain-containing protein [Rhodoalgimonas zhirmunskyi]
MTDPFLQTPNPEQTGSATIRVAAIAGGFFVITAGLLFIQPGSDAPAERAVSAAPETAQTVPQQQVSRAETGLDLIAPNAAFSDLTTDNDRLGKAVTLASAPARALASPSAESGEMQDMTRSILSQLGQPSATPAPENPAQQTPAPDQLRDLTAGVLASLRQVTAKPGQTSLETLVVQSLRQGQSDAYLDALINEAVASGQVTTPSALITEGGKVDTATLLATLVRKSDADPLQEPRLRPEAMTGGPGVEVRVIQRAGETKQYNFYTVQPGDSLGGIANKFYGDARHFTAIYEANRNLLSSPDTIRAGQRLSIPTL